MTLFLSLLAAVADVTQETMPRLRLVYFPVRAKAEPIRMALRYGQILFEDQSPADYYGVGWGAGAKGMAPFGQLPVLVVDDKPPLAQSGSIMRYVASLSGLAPKDVCTRLHAGGSNS